jgi:hypothetical protein
VFGDDRKMDKSKALMIGIVLFLILVVGFFGFREAMSPTGGPGNEEEPCLRISNGLYCNTDDEDVRFSKNAPYFVGEKYHFWIHLTVCANSSVRDVVLLDELGGELMVEGFSFVPIDKPGPYNYTFEYGAYESGGGVSVTDGTSVWTGYLNETGVAFDGFVVYWTDETLKTNFEWDIGSMDAGEAREVYLTVSTDTNPDGQQEFASPGTYFLNSGATVEGIVDSTGKKTSAESCGIEIEVFEKFE